MAARRWEVDKECLPARVHGIWPPHITLTAPWIAVHACMGLAADLVFRKGSGTGGATLWPIYAAALGAAWLSWPPALIRGNRLQAAAEAVGTPHFIYTLTTPCGAFPHTLCRHAHMR